MSVFKKGFRFALSLLPLSLVAGIFVAFYQLNTLSETMAAELMAAVGSMALLVAVSAVQAVAYTFICGLFGYVLAVKIGLWKSFEFNRKHALKALIICVLGGIAFSLDHWVFGSFIDGICETNIASLNAVGVIASVLYGGIVEEVMLRLFFMSLIAFVIGKMFCRKHKGEKMPLWVFVVANIIAAIAFAAGHLPATLTLFGDLTPLILFRCFLLNGGFGLLFGWFFRKYGIAYAMAAHALLHIVAKLIWFIFI